MTYKFISHLLLFDFMRKYFLLFVLVQLCFYSAYSQEIKTDSIPKKTPINAEDLISTNKLNAEGDLEGVIRKKTANKWDDVHIIECGKGKIQLPKTYAPNDYVGEEWKAEFWEIDNIRLIIFDKKGKQLLHLDLKANYMASDISSSGLKHKFYDLSWNGQYQGNPLPTAFYTFMLEIEDTEKTKCRKSAQVFLNQ